MWLFAMVHWNLALRAWCRIWTCADGSPHHCPTQWKRRGTGFFDKLAHSPVFMSLTFRQSSSIPAFVCVHYNRRESRPQLISVHRSASVRLRYLATPKYPGRS